MIDETEHTCQFCYYEYFDGRAYPCSMCVCGEERKDMFMPKGRQNKRKTEPTISKMEQVEEPQLTPNYCGTCRHRDVPCGDLPCDVCHGYSNYAPQDEPQTEQVGVPFGLMDEATFKSHCLNCQRDIADIKCLDCDGDKYFVADEPQTDCAWR
jgi:hypothetical protein